MNTSVRIFSHSRSTVLTHFVFTFFFFFFLSSESQTRLVMHLSGLESVVSSPGQLFSGSKEELSPETPSRVSPSSCDEKQEVKSNEDI